MFKKIQTQHFYKNEDKNAKKEGMYQYIYWPEVDYNAEDYKNKENNEIYKNVILIGFDPESDLQKTVILSDLSAEDYQVEIRYGNCVVPEGVTKIGKYCFHCCPLFKNITLPSTLKEIGDMAFSVSDITSIIIPEGVKKIGNGCFFCCNQLTSIILPSTLKEIDDYAFSNTKITRIVIPESVTEMGHNCFEDCDQLQEIICPKRLEDFIREELKGKNVTIRPF